MASRFRLITLQSLGFARNAAYEVMVFSLRSFNQPTLERSRHSIRKNKDS